MSYEVTVTGSNTISVDVSQVGQQGVKGVNYITGGWVVSTAYADSDVLYNNGTSYICILAHTSASTDEPGVGVNTATYWEVFSASGADGADGADGAGFTGGSYNAGTGVVTFTSDDGLGFVTGDLRGADGAGSGTVTSVDITGGTGITSTGGPITSTGAVTVALDAATQTSLGLADSALQPGDIGVTIQGYSAVLYAPIASPTFTGTPTAPTATSGTNTTQVATTAFVTDAVSGTAGGLSIGDYLKTERDPTADGLLSADGSTYLQSAYPDLYSVIGLIPDYSTAVSDPATLPTTRSRGVSWSSDNTYLAVASDDTPFVLIYKRSGDTFTKLADPASLPTALLIGLDFDGTDTYLAVVTNVTPYLEIYKRSGDTFTKLTTPTAGGQIFPVKFSPDSTYLAVGMNASPYLEIYKRSGDTFTKLTTPTVGGGTINGLSWSPDGTYLACAGSTTSTKVLKRSGDTFTDLGVTLSSSTSYDCVFSPDGTKIAVVGFGSPRTQIYSRSGDTFTDLGVTLTSSTAVPLVVDYSPDGRSLIVGIQATPWIQAYSISSDGTTFSEKPSVFADFAGIVRAIATAPTGGDYLAVGGDGSKLKIIKAHDYDTATEFAVPNEQPLYIKAE
jgi:WD40 repeat protein